MTGRVAYCVGTGRCGTTFVADLARAEPTVAASHERLRLGATFHLFCSWYRLPVDDEGFLRDREDLVRADLAEHAVSFEANALLSHSLVPLHRRFRPRILLVVRRPDHTVGSFVVRGWFTSPGTRADPGKAPSYREGEEPRHFFGRMTPTGPEHARWCALTPLGRVAWFWAARNRAILEQLAVLPPEDVALVRLEELDHARWGEIARFLGWTSTVGPDAFAALAARRPNTGPRSPRLPPAWSDRERAELEAEVGPVASALGYESDLAALDRGAPALAAEPTVAEAVARLREG